MFCTKHGFVLLTTIVFQITIYVENASGLFINESIYQTYSRSKRATVSCSRPNVFKCDKNNECIATTSLCDGQQDCKDGSDETVKCRERIKTCPDFSFRCSYGACVDGDAECDGKQDCVDGSDENTAKCPKAAASNTCGSTKFTCTSGQCIPKYALCDGNKDCTDGSDETYESCSKIRCPDFSFQCQYGGCIDGDSKCDGQIDCADGSDENEILCGKPPPIVTSPAPPIVAKGCVLPDQPKNGKHILFGGLNLAAGTVVQSGTILQYSCNSNYALYPSTATMFCIDNKWSLQFPSCVSTCPKRESQSVDITCTFDGKKVDCSKPMLEGTRAEMKCKAHYEPTEDYRSNIILCQGGSWDYDIIKCIPVCGNIIPKGGTPFIVNGNATIPGDFPWHVGIYQYDQLKNKIIHICGGSILNGKVIISAAHCFTETATGKRRPGDKFYVAAAKYYREFEDSRDTFTQRFDVTEIIIPKEYRGLESSYTHDLALLVLNDTLQVSNLVQPVCIDWQNFFEDQQLRDNNYGTVVGWGKEKGDALLGSEELKQLVVPFIDRDTCFDTVPHDFKIFLTPDKFCAGYTSGKSVCQGDSGGGLVFIKEERQKYYLRGLVSNGPIKTGQCDSRQVGAYTQISKYLDIIRDIELKYRPK